MARWRRILAAALIAPLLLAGLPARAQMLQAIVNDRHHSGAAPTNTLLQAVVTKSGIANGASLQFGSANTPGSTILVLLTFENDVTSVTISDGVNSGNYSVDNLNHGTFGGFQATVVNASMLANTSSSKLTITVAAWGTSVGYSLALLEVSGQGAVDATAQAKQITGSGATINGSLTTATAGDLIVGCISNFNTITTDVDTGFTLTFSPQAHPSSYEGGEYDLNAGSPTTLTLSYGGGAPTQYYVAAWTAYK